MVSRDSEVHRSHERQRLLNTLLESVKECQARFGGRAELATEADGRVVELCSCLEEVLSHGLRSKPLTASKGASALRHVTDLVSSSLNFSRGSPQEILVFWHYVREHLTRHELERYLLLKHVWSDIGRGRAWMRAALNERSLERYLHSLLASPQHLSVFYEDWAYLLDPERSATLTNMAAGLGSVLFAISIDNPQLNQESCLTVPEGDVATHLCSEPVICSPKGIDYNSSDSSSKRRNEQKRRRRVQPQIISFGDDDGLATGSPPTETLRVSEASPSGEVSDAGSTDELASEGPKSRPGYLSLSTSPLVHRLDSTLRLDSRTSGCSNSNKNRAQTLTPVTNVNVGELIPVTLVTEEAYSEEDSLSVPSYSEDTECAALALLATQRLMQSNCVDFSPQEPSSGTHRTPTDVCTSLNGETREVLVTVLALKEELQAENRQLRRQLELAEERVTNLQAEGEAAERTATERIQRLEARSQALTRENELLKHQLRKYVGAVQLLKRDGQQAHEALASLQAAQQARPLESTVPDYHHEAMEYEKKLIQVAEMHGELMEFNERLHRLLQLKDAQLRRLREELVDLRGPLPDDVQTSDDDVSVTSDYDASSLGAAARVLVNIWIPSAFLTGGSSDVHHVYQVFIRIRDDEWNIYRRYAQFYSLHKELKKQDAVVNTFDFPPKKTIGNKDARFVEERRRRLQHYLRCVVNHLVQTNLELAANPDKELLIGLIPFFGEVTEERSGRRHASSRNPFTRSRPTNAGQPSEPSPHYQGL